MLLIFKWFIVTRKPRSEMTTEELKAAEELEFATGPLSVLTQSVKSNSQACNLFAVVLYISLSTSLSKRIYYRFLSTVVTTANY